MASLLEGFADHENALWKKLSEQIGGTLTDLEGTRHDKVVAKVGQWVVTLDKHGEPGYQSEHMTTRLRAPFVNPDGLRFMVRREGVFENIGKLVGMQDIRVGYEPFDRMFLVQGSDPDTIKKLLADDRLRQLVASEPNIHLQVRDAGNYFEDYSPHDVDELVLELHDEVQDLDRLKRLFDLFARTLDGLCGLGSAYKA